MRTYIFSSLSLSLSLSLATLYFSVNLERKEGNVLLKLARLSSCYYCNHIAVATVRTLQQRLNLVDPVDLVYTIVRPALPVKTTTNRQTDSQTHAEMKKEAIAIAIAGDKNLPFDHVNVARDCHIYGL